MILWLITAALAGEVSGVVQSATGEPLNDTLVLAYDNRLKYELAYAEPDGSFVVDELKASERRIRFLPPDAANAVEHYFDNGVPICEADLVAVPAVGTVDLGLVRLPEGGRVNGRLMTPQGSPLVGATVSSRPAGVSPTSLPRKARTDESGAFGLQGIPVTADGPLWSFQVETDTLPLQYLGSTYVLDSAEAFGVGLGDVVDIGDWTLLPGATLSGTVAGAGAPVMGTVFATTTGRTRSSAIVDGRYEIAGLAPGEATIWVESPNHARTWFPSEPRPSGTILVNDGDTIGGLDIQLDPDGAVSGVLEGLEDFTGARVSMVDEGRSVMLATDVQADGSFVVRGLPEGRWGLELSPAEGTDLVNGPLLDDEGNLFAVELGRGEALDLGVVPAPRGAVVEGVVRDRETGEGVYGAWVYVVNANTQTSTTVQTGRAGRYRAEGLPAGVYRMHVEYTPYCAPDPSWVARYYPDQRNELLTGSIPLAPGQVTKWDPGVPPDMDQDKMDDVWERRFGLNTSVDDAFEDLDEDGFTNLDEYLLGTNPARQPSNVAGCGTGAASLLFLGMPWMWRRRKRAPPKQLPV